MPSIAPPTTHRSRRSGGGTAESHRGPARAPDLGGTRLDFSDLECHDHNLNHSVNTPSTRTRSLTAAAKHSAQKKTTRFNNEHDCGDNAGSDCRSSGDESSFGDNGSGIRKRKKSNANNIPNKVRRSRIVETEELASYKTAIGKSGSASLEEDRSTDKDTNHEAAIDLLQKCGASKNLLLTTNNLLRDKENTQHSIKLGVIKSLDILGTEYLDKDQFKNDFESLQQELHEAFIGFSGNKYKGRFNFGDCLSEMTALIICKHYAPISCCGKKCEGILSLIYRLNASIVQFLKVLPRSLHKEANGGEWTEEHVTRIDKSIRFIDLLLFAPMEKKNVEKEYEEFARDHAMDISQLDLIAFIFYAMHVKFYTLVNKDGSVVSSLCASCETYPRLFGECNAFQNDVTNFCARFPHGQAIATRAVKNPSIYSNDRLEEEGNNLLHAYSAVARKVGCFQVPDSTEILFRFGGKLTDDEREALREAMLEACRKGGRTTGKMRTTVKEMRHYLEEEGLFDSEEEMLEYLKEIFPPNYWNTYEGSLVGGKKGGATLGQMKTDGKEVRNVLIAEGRIEEGDEEGAVDAIWGLCGSPTANAYKGSLVGGKKGGATLGQMRTDAKEVRNVLIAEGRIEEGDEEGAVDAIREFCGSPTANAYRGSLTLGQMQRDGKEVRNVLIAEGRIEEGDEEGAVDAIREFCGSPTANAYRGSLKSGQMQRDGKEVRNVLIAEGRIEEGDEEGAVDAIREFCGSPTANAYKGSLVGSKKGAGMGGLVGAPLPPPPKGINYGKWEPYEIESLVAGCLFLRSAEKYADISTFVPTRNAKQTYSFLHSKFRNDKETLKLSNSEQVTTFTEKLLSTPYQPKKEKSLKRQIPMTFNLGEKLGASIGITRVGNISSCVVKTENEGSRLRLGDKILYIGKGTGDGAFFHHREWKLQEWAQKLSPDTRRMVLVERLCDWPSLHW